MVRLILVVILGFILDDDRIVGGTNPVRFWLVVAAMNLVSFYVN
ncbi:MAG: hypothetical protein WB762_15855 [Candidatus Sulfotelmatobacter sp.]